MTVKYHPEEKKKFPCSRSSRATGEVLFVHGRCHREDHGREQMRQDITVGQDPRIVPCRLCRPREPAVNKAGWAVLDACSAGRRLRVPLLTEKRGGAKGRPRELPAAPPAADQLARWLSPRLGGLRTSPRWELCCSKVEGPAAAVGRDNPSWEPVQQPEKEPEQLSAAGSCL